MIKKQNLHATILLIAEYNIILYCFFGDGIMSPTKTVLLSAIGTIALGLNYFIFDYLKDAKDI
jgi:hypothetical protein